MTDASSAAQAPPDARDGDDGLTGAAAALGGGPGAVQLGGAGTATGRLSGYLAIQAGQFLRALPEVDLHTLNRVGAALHTFDSLLDPTWARELREELGRFSTVLGQERAYTRRLTRLLTGLDSLTSADTRARRSLPPSAPIAVPIAAALAWSGGAAVGTPGGAAGSDPSAATPAEHTSSEGMLARHPGAPKARALLERQLSLGRSRAHTTALQELGSARFHALADRMTLLMSELPLRAGAAGSPDAALVSCVVAEAAALTAAADALPLVRAAVPYTGDALHDPGDDQPWRQLRALLLRTRYALELCSPLLGQRAGRPLAALGELAGVMARHRDAVEAAEAAALAALTPRITPATAYVLGVVHADQRLEVEAARHAFGCSWPDLYRSGWLTDAWLTTR